MRNHRALWFFGLAAAIYALGWALADRSLPSALGSHPITALLGVVIMGLVLAIPGYICGKAAQLAEDKETIKNVSPELADLLEGNTTAGPHSK